MNKKDILLFIGTLLLNLIVFPFIIFWIGYAAGWMLKLILGSYFTEAFAIFGFSLPASKIPVLIGIIGVFRAYICPPVKYNNQKD